MNYYGPKELADSFRTVRKNTLIIAEELGEQHYGFCPAPGARTVAQLLVHIAVATKLPEQVHAVEHRSTMEGFDFPKFVSSMMAEEGKSRTKADIVALLKESGERYAKWLDGLSDHFLAERVSFPAIANQAPKSRFEMLLGVKEHEMHHRGQLMLIERMVGVVPHMTRAMQERMASMQRQGATA